MKIYSPSQTKLFLQCPVAWALSREGVTPKTYNKGTVYAIRGSAVSSGLEHFNMGYNSSDIQRVIEEAVSSDWDHYKISQREWGEFRSLPPTQDEIAKQALMLVEAYANTPRPYDVLHSEYIFSDHGNARADVIGKIMGNIIPIDYKCKDAPASDYMRHLLKQEYRYDWQLMHYCWATSEVFNTECVSFGIVILWYGKRCEVEYVVYHLKPERLALWYESAQVVWERMFQCESGGPLHEAANHRTLYGPCEYYKACLEYQRDPQLMANDYFTIARRVP